VRLKLEGGKEVDMRSVLGITQPGTASTTTTATA
jgi:hypothetical protein